MVMIFTNMFLESFELFELLKYDDSIFKIFQDHHSEQKGEECPKYRVLRDFGILFNFLIYKPII